MSAEKKYASENGRDDYKFADVEDYFNYMGMLAAEVRGPLTFCLRWQKVTLSAAGCSCHKCKA